MKKLERIFNKVTTTKSKYEEAIENLEFELKKISEVDDFVLNDYQDGGICIGIQGYNNCVPIDDLFEIIENNGTFTREDIIDSIY